MLYRQPDETRPVANCRDALGAMPLTALQTLTRIAVLVLIACCAGYAAKYLAAMTSS